MQLNQDTQALLAMLQEAGVKPFHQGTPEEARAAMTQLMGLVPVGDELVTLNEYLLPDTGVTLRVTRPQTTPRAIIVYYHGGGWVCGNAKDYDSLARELATKSNCLVVMVDYRLAPEHAYPTPLNDCWDAINWVDNNRATLDAEGLPLIVAGDSSGGNLAAVVAQRAASGELDLAMQILVYPVMDFDLTRPSYSNPDNQLLLTTNDMVWFWDHYAGTATDRLAPSLSPLRGELSAQLAPALIISAEYDVLHDENQAYASQLSQAGAQVEYLNVKGEIHGFIGLMGVLASSRKTLEKITLFINSQL